MADYTGVRVHEISKNLIDELYKNKEIATWDCVDPWYENLYLVLKDETKSSASALARVKNNKIVLINSKIHAGDLYPKNKEQIMALDALLDDSIKVVALTGKAGVGKSLLALASALAKLQNKKYNKIIVCKNMVQVKKNDIGFLPGSLYEKFLPFNQGVLSNMEYLLGADKKKVEDMIEQYKIEFMPLALARGISFNNCLVLGDEMQNCDNHEILTLGTRISLGSKLILLGDLNQIDVAMKKNESGLFKFINSEKSKNSPFVAFLELVKSERGEVSELFSDIFEG